MGLRNNVDDDDDDDDHEHVNNKTDDSRTVEPSITVTSLMRLPSYYGHFFVLAKDPYVSRFSTCFASF